MTGLVRCNGTPGCEALVLPGRVCFDCKSKSGPGTRPPSASERTAGVAFGARKAGEKG